MKKSMVLGLAVCTIYLNSFSAFVVADDKYPASDFKPTVTYIDESAPQPSTSAEDEKYPAANFQPKVTFTDESVASQPQLNTAAAYDANYPAANFQSKVIYSDESAISAPGQSDQTDPNYPAAYYKPKVIFP